MAFAILLIELFFLLHALICFITFASNIIFNTVFFPLYWFSLVSVSWLNTDKNQCGKEGAHRAHLACNLQSEWRGIQGTILKIETWCRKKLKNVLSEVAHLLNLHPTFSQIPVPLLRRCTTQNGQIPPKPLITQDNACFTNVPTKQYASFLICLVLTFSLEFIKYFLVPCLIILLCLLIFISYSGDGDGHNPCVYHSPLHFLLFYHTNRIIESY